MRSDFHEFIFLGICYRLIAKHMIIELCHNENRQDKNNSKTNVNYTQIRSYHLLMYTVGVF